MVSLPKHFGPYAIAVPVTTITFSLASLALKLGALGIVGGALVGFGWSMLLGLVLGKLQRYERWRSHLANAPVLVAIVATGLLVGGGYMYGFVMSAALSEPSTTKATLSALMQPSVPYFIAINTLLEAFIVPLVIYLNWQIPKRRTLIVVAVLVYFAMRVYSYLTFVPMRLEIAQHAISSQEVSWFKRSLAADYRGVLNILTHVFFILTAFVPVALPNVRASSLERELT
jgi:hypothetical protein